MSWWLWAMSFSFLCSWLSTQSTHSFFHHLLIEAVFLFHLPYNSRYQFLFGCWTASYSFCYWGLPGSSLDHWAGSVSHCILEGIPSLALQSRGFFFTIWIIFCSTELVLFCLAVFKCYFLVSLCVPAFLRKCPNDKKNQLLFIVSCLISLPHLHDYPFTTNVDRQVHLNLNGNSQLSVSSEPLASFFCAWTKVETTKGSQRNNFLPSVVVSFEHL